MANLCLLEQAELVLTVVAVKNLNVNMTDLGIVAHLIVIKPKESRIWQPGCLHRLL